MFTLLLITLILVTLLEVTFESIYGDKHDLISNIRLLATTVFTIGLGLLIGTYLSVITYFFIRLSIFDLAYSKINKKVWLYLGSNTTDLQIKKLPKEVNISMRVISLVLAIVINYNSVAIENNISTLITSIINLIII